MKTEIEMFGKLGLTLFLQLIVLVIVVTADTYLQKKQKKTLLLIIVMAFSLVVQDGWTSLPDGRTDGLLRTLAEIYGCSVRPVILVLFLKTLDMNRKRQMLWWLAAANAAIYITAFIVGIAFRITEENLFWRGPLGYACHVLSAGLLALLIYESLNRVRQWKAAGCFILVLDAFLLGLATAWDWVQGSNGTVSCLTIVVVSSCLFYYLWLHMQSAYAHEQALASEQRIQIMMTQIQPHFLFNTLSTIQALCRIDPEKASETTEKFGTYLRMNIDSLGRAGLIPFQKELEHTRIYADIEMMRFPYIHISYDIQEDDFEVPALSIQPMVENAIRHGVRGRYNGLVKITTHREEKEVVVTVTDNGKGFDPENSKATDGTHIGIRNVRGRVEMLCGGTLSIESKPGAGSTVTMRLPHRKETE